MNPLNEKTSIVLGIVASLAGARPSLAVDPACRADGGPNVCVGQDDMTPVEGVHFGLDLTTDPDRPVVIFAADAEDWVVWSQVSEQNTAAAPLGTLKLDDGVSNEDFGIKI